MADPATTTQVDKRRVVFDALTNDPNYKDNIDPDFDKFTKKLSDPEIAKLVYGVLFKDKHYRPDLPEENDFIGIFEPRPGGTQFYPVPEEFKPKAKEEPIVTQEPTAVAAQEPIKSGPGLMPAIQEPEAVLVQEANELLKANENLDFVKRIADPNLVEPIKNEDGTVSSHKMAAEVDEKGNWYVIPTIVNQNGKLVDLGDRALDYALETGENIPVKNKELALWMASNGYKQTEFAKNFDKDGEVAPKAKFDDQKALPTSIEDIQKTIEEDIVRQQTELQNTITEDIQAEFDAGNLTEDEANLRLQNRFAKAQEDLFTQADKDFQTQISQFDRAQTMEGIRAEVEEAALPQAGSVSRVTNRVLTNEQLQANRVAVQKNEEKRQAFNQIAIDQLAKLPEPKRDPVFVSPFAVGAELSKRNISTEDMINKYSYDMFSRLKDMTDNEAAGFFSGLGDQGTKMIPFLGSLIEIPELMKKKNVLSKPEDQRNESEQQLVNAIAVMNTFERSGQKPTTYEWGEMVGQMIPFLGEFAGTAGVATTVAKAVGKKLIKGGLKKGLVNYTVRGTAGAIGQATANPQRYATETIRRMTPMDSAIIDLKDQQVDEIFRERLGEKFPEAAIKGYLSQVSEMITERLGFAYGAAGAKFMTSKVGKLIVNPTTLKKYTLSQIAKRRGIGSMGELQKLRDRIGLQGLVTEIWGEELPNMALNDVITGDSGRTILENLNPLDENLLKMVIPMAILQGGVYAPTGAVGLGKFIQGKVQTKEVEKKTIKTIPVKTKPVQKLKVKTIGQRAAEAIRKRKIKTKEDAIKEQKPAEIPVREQPKVSEKVRKKDEGKPKEPAREKEKEKPIPPKAVEEKKTVTKKLFPAPKVFADPSALKTQLSTVMTNQNRVSELLLTAKEKGEFTLKGKPKQTAPETTKKLYEQSLENKGEITRLRSEIEAAKKQAKAPEVIPISQNQEIENLRTEITSLESVLSIPANKKLRQGLGKKADIAKIRGIVGRVGELKRQRIELTKQLGETKGVLSSLSQVDPNARMVRDAKPKSKFGTTQTNYSFNALGIEGKIEQISMQGQPDIFYARSIDGKKATFGSDSPGEAIRELRKQKPRTVTQTGEAAIVVKGDIPSKSMTTSVQHLQTSQKVIRTEIEPRTEGETFRKMKIFLAPKKGEDKGKIATVFITTRGRVVDINKKTGKPNKSLISNQVLKDNPDIIELLRNPKPVTTARMATPVDVDATETNTDNFTEKGRNWAKKIRAKKVHVPRGALRASFGFEEVYNGALEIAATILESSGKFVEALRAAMKHIRLSKWYAEQSPVEQFMFEKKAEDAIRAFYDEAGVPLEGKTIEAVVEKERAAMNKENKNLRRDAVARMIFNRRADLSIGAFKTRVFVEGINTQTNELEREMLPFIIEKTSIPKGLNRPDLEDAYKNRDVKKLDKIAAEIKIHNNQVWEQMTRGKNDMAPELIEDYITHIWDIDKNKRTDVINYFTTNNKWANRRYIRTLAEGIEVFKLTPKLLDISKILTIHGSMATNVEANKNFLDALKTTLVAGKRLIIHNTVKDIPGNYKPGEQIHPTLRAFKIHPDVPRALWPIFQREIGKDWKLVRGIENFNSVVKTMQLTISMFHHGALIEAAIPLLGFETVSAVLKQSIGRGLLAAKSKINGNRTWAQLPYAFQRQALSIDALNSGLQLGASIDIRVQQIEGIFKKIADGFEKTGKFVGGKPGGFLLSAGPRVAEKIIEGNNAVLWDYLHDTLKLMAYEQEVRKIPESKWKTPELWQKAKIEKAQFVNDSFGGQNFDVLGISPLMLQFAKFTLLSPDWTLSTLRQAAPGVLGIPWYGAKAIGGTNASKAIGDTFNKMFLNPLGKNLTNKQVVTGLGKAMGAQFTETADLRANVGLRFWGKAIILYGIGYSLLNAWNRERDMEENPEAYTKEEIADPWSRTIWRNSSGHRTHVFGGRFEDGSETYLRQGKQFRELQEFVIDDTPDFGISFPKPALKKFGGKMSPLIQFLSKSFTGVSPSGFQERDLKNLNSWEWTAAWIKVTTKSLGPMSFTNFWRDDKEFKLSDLIFPSSKGMTMSKGVRYTMHYMATGEADMLTLVMQEAMRNKLNHRAMFTASLAQFKTLATREIAGDIKEIDEAKLLLQEEGLSAKEVKAIERRITTLEKDKEEKMAGEELIQKNLEDWIAFQEEVGAELDERDKSALALEKARKSFLLNRKK